jgi:hypothetical protein
MEHQDKWLVCNLHPNCKKGYLEWNPRGIRKNIEKGDSVTMTIFRIHYR